ncbi:MAG: ester cyclase [Acidimicrobiales bacterium]
MSTNRNAFDQAIAAWNAGDLDQYLDLYDESIRLHGYSPEPMSKTEAEAFYRGLWAALDDLHLHIERVVEQGDALAVYALMTGTHTGELFGVTGTGTHIQQPVMTVLRFDGGRCVERWSVADTYGVLAQIGALPQPV